MPMLVAIIRHRITISYAFQMRCKVFEDTYQVMECSVCIRFLNLLIVITCMYVLRSELDADCVKHNPFDLCPTPMVCTASSQSWRPFPQSGMCYCQCEWWQPPPGTSKNGNFKLKSVALRVTRWHRGAKWLNGRVDGLPATQVARGPVARGRSRRTGRVIVGSGHPAGTRQSAHWIQVRNAPTLESCTYRLVLVQK